MRALLDTNILTRLIELKVALSAANQPIQRLIFELAEHKASIAMLNKVSTKHGMVVEGYAGVQVRYVAQLRKPDIDREIRRLEQEIDRIQDLLDHFNHATMITIDGSVLTETEPLPSVLL